MKENTARIGDGHDRSGNESFPCRLPEINYEKQSGLTKVFFKFSSKLATHV